MRLRYWLFSFFVCTAGMDGQGLPPCSIETVAGGGISLHGDGGPATEADLLGLRDIAMGADDSYYLADRDNRSIWRVFPDQHIEALPGAGTLEFPSAVAVSATGTVYYAEDFGRRILRLNEDGSTTHVAGNGSAEFSGDGGPATEAGIGKPRRMDVGPDGSLYFVVPEHQRVRRIWPDGVIETVAGSGPAGINDGHYTGDGIPAVEARLNRPSDVAVDASGRIYIADTWNQRVRRVDLNGMITTAVGRGLDFGEPTMVAADSYIRQVTEIAVGAGNLLHFYEPGSRNYVLVDAEGLLEIRSRAGGGISFDVDSVGDLYRVFSYTIARQDADDRREFVAGTQGRGQYGEDGTSAREVALVEVIDMAIDDEGRLYVAELLNRARRIEGDGTIATYSSEASGRAVATAPDGSVYTGGSSVLFRVSPDGTTERFLSGQGGPLELWRMTDVAVDSMGQAYVIHQPRNSGVSGTVLGVVGDGSRVGIELIPPDDEGSGNIRMEPELIAVDSQDRLVVLVDPPGLEKLLMRWDPVADTWETLLRTSDFMSPVTSLAVGPDDRIYLAEQGLTSIWVLTPEGELSVVAGRRELFSELGGDGGPAADARFGSRNLQIAVSRDGDLYLDDGDVIRRINRVSECDVRRRPVPARFGTVNGASFAGATATGQIFSIFGRDLGPREIVTTRLVDGRLATELGAVRVWIDGIAAPLIFVSEGQVSGVVPYAAQAGLRRNDAGELAFDERTEIVVEYNGVASTPHFAFIGQAGPGMFTADASGRGQAAALNEDGSINSAANPAATGSVIVLYGTGEGRTDPAGVDGKPAEAPLPRPVLPVRVMVNGEDAEVLYAGGAPGFTAGLFQMNVRLPQGATGTVEIVVHVGAEASQAVTFEVAP